MPRTYLPPFHFDFAIKACVNSFGTVVLQVALEVVHGLEGGHLLVVVFSAIRAGAFIWTTQLQVTGCFTMFDVLIIAIDFRYFLNVAAIFYFMLLRLIRRIFRSVFSKTGSTICLKLRLLIIFSILPSMLLYSFVLSACITVTGMLPASRAIST